MPVIDEPVQVLDVAGARAIAAIRPPTEPDRRIIQMLDVPSLARGWSATARGPVVAIDGDAVAYIDDGAEVVPILRDAATGTVRWRAAPLPSDVGQIYLAGPYVGFAQGTAISLHHREDGSAAATLPSASLVTAIDGHILVGGDELVVCGMRRAAAAA